MGIVSRINLCLLVLSTCATGQESKPVFDASFYTRADFTITQQTIRNGAVEVIATQVKPKPKKEGLETPYYCRAWVDIKVHGRHTRRITYPDIDPVGASYGLFMPKQQPIPGHIFFEKFGDYDGRLYLVDTIGNITDLKGGWFFLDPSKRYLFSEYVSDGPEITIFDLKEKSVVFKSDIPNDVDWYRFGDKYAFMTIDKPNAPDSAGFVQLKVLDLVHRKLQSMSISERQLQTLPKVQSPVAREDQSFKDCEF